MTYYYLPARPPVRISCQDYNAKLAFGLNAIGQPFQVIQNNTGILINTTYTSVSSIMDTSNNRTGGLRPCCGSLAGPSLGPSARADWGPALQSVPPPSSASTPPTSACQSPLGL